MKLKNRKTSPQSKNAGDKQVQISTALEVKNPDTAALEAAWQARLAPIIERLRASRLDYAGEEEMRGMTAGRLWAEERAEAIELQRLREASELWWGLQIQNDSPYSHAQQLFFAIRPEQDGNCAAAAAFWAAITGRRALPERIYVVSFAERAMEVWDQVEDEIYR